MARQYAWVPKEDITLHELAMALSVLLPNVAGVPAAVINGAIESLPENVRRHFVHLESN